MASEKQRQKKLAKQKAKRKAKHQQIVKTKNLGLAKQLEQASSAPVLHCWTQRELFDEGMGQVILSRELPDSSIAVAVFLVDMYCLGVKNAFGRIVNRSEYDQRIGKTRKDANAMELPPASARKLVEGAIEFAREAGFSPHPDYHKAKMLFGDIDVSASDSDYEYGDDGLHHFIAGPHDDKNRCQYVVSTLRRHCGEGNYYATIPLGKESDAALLEHQEAD